MRTDDIIYNIPVSRREHYRHRSVALRSADPREIAATLCETNPQSIVSVQILSPAAWLESSIKELPPVPVDLLLGDVEREYPNLYRWSALSAESPARITIPVVSGFGKAFKLATSLGFAVKLEVAQPDTTCIGELLQVLDLYLHRSGISQPVEFFHSLLLALYHDQPTSLWAIQEEDPAEYCYVTDDGDETIRRFAGRRDIGSPIAFLARFRADLLEQSKECSNCEYYDRCGGYFKWPDGAYRCDGIKRVFGEILIAAEELKIDVAAFPPRQETTNQ